jgi:hypothetical protein
MIAASNNNETSRLLPQQRQHGDGAQEEEDNEGMIIPASLYDDTSPRYAYHSHEVPKNDVPRQHVDQDGVAPRRGESSLAASAAAADDDNRLSMSPMTTVRQQFPETLPIGAFGMSMPSSMEAETPAVVAPDFFGVDSTIGYWVVEIGGDGRRSSGGTFSPMVQRESDWVVVHHERVVGDEQVTGGAVPFCSSWPLIMAVGVAVLAQMLVGYNIGVMNAPEPVRGVNGKLFVLFLQCCMTDT